MKTARQIAFEILNRIQKDNSYSNLILDTYLDKSELNQVDRAFVSALVYGVTERMITLDYELSRCLKQPLKKLKPQVLTILRIGAYQVLYMDRIPDSAAINESVKLCKNNGASFATGLVNAVLRKASANGLTETDNLSLKYSVPEWLCNLWADDYGNDNALSLLESLSGSVDTVIRINSLKTTKMKLVTLLEKEGFESMDSKLSDDILVVKGTGALHKTKAYLDGLFHVQDTASQLCCSALGVKKGETVLDICAAPGGKSFTLAQHMENSGVIYSMDLYEHRLELIKKGAQRLGITNIKTVVNDGSVYNEGLPMADKILCDVPCAGLGVIRKKPEIRYKDPVEVDKLPKLQYSILCISSKYLKVGGTLVYSTYSLNKAENENIVNQFLNEHKNFESVPVLSDLKRYAEDTDYVTLMPHLHDCDGFFIAGLRKIKEV